MCAIAVLTQVMRLRIYIWWPLKRNCHKLHETALKVQRIAAVDARVLNALEFSGFIKTSFSRLGGVLVSVLVTGPRVAG
jgi:hypothetical protein